MRIERDDLTRDAVVDLVALHQRAAHANSPPGCVFALDLAGLRDPSVVVWSAWDGAGGDSTLLGIVAVKPLDAGHCELKSMRTHPDHVRRGVGAALLDHATSHARDMGATRISLETGSNAAYAAARALYERAGFVRCKRFGSYPPSRFSRYYTLDL